MPIQNKAFTKKLMRKMGTLETTVSTHCCVLNRCYHASNSGASCEEKWTRSPAHIHDRITNKGGPHGSTVA